MNTTPDSIDFRIRELRNIFAFLVGAAIVAAILFACAGSAS